MVLTNRDPSEDAFWQDIGTQSVLLTIDRCFWPICLINILVEFAWVPRVVLRGVGERLQPARYSLAVVLCGHLMAALAVSMAIKRNRALYYRHRGKVMLFNRLIRIALYAQFFRYVDKQHELMAFVTDKITAGRNVLLVIILILIHVPGNHLLWSLYFPLPFNQSIWLDIVQQGVRLMTVTRCARLLGHRDLRPTVTSACKALNAYINMYSMETMQREPFDRRCVEDGPLLLSLFSWWFFGSFLPTYTAWYCESMLRQKFRRRQLNTVGGFWDLPHSFLLYLTVSMAVASFSWVGLQLLMAPQRNRDLVLGVLHWIHQQVTVGG